MIQKVLFVCLGNICRSPLAEGIFRQLVIERGLQIETDSCGTANYHVGDKPDTRSIKKGKEYGIDISNLRGRQFSTNDFEDFDVIFVMDQSNLQNVLRLDPHHQYTQKVKLLLEEQFPNTGMEVPDPYYGGEQGFEDIYQMMHAACSHFLNRITDETR